MPLPRMHLVELEDLAICPSIVRDFGTDYLQHVQSSFQLYLPMVDLVQNALEEAGETRIVDLCAGGGGPTLDIVRELRQRGVAATATLTDRFPNQRSGGCTEESHCRCHPDSVDARDVPPDLAGLRIVCNAFHHFAPTAAREILRNAVEARQPIAILEIPERKLSVILATFLAPFMMLLLTPKIRPFRWSRLLLTYLIPAVPLLCLWDGVVSQLRAYTEDELEALGKAVEPTGYTWTTGKIAHSKLPTRLTYLIGQPIP